MKKVLDILGNGLGLLLLVGLIVFLIFSLNGIRQGKDTPGASELPTATSIPESEPTPIPLPTDEPVDTVFKSPLLPTSTPAPVKPEPATPTPVIERPPLCKFESKTQKIVADASVLDTFKFSEPKVIFSRESPIEIIEWLPDNQRLLVHVRVRDKAKETIEVVDTTTGESKIYAQDLENANLIRWVPEKQAVVYADYKTAAFSGIDQYGLWLSDGVSNPPQLLLKDANLLMKSASLKAVPSEIKAIFRLGFGEKDGVDPEVWRYSKSAEADKWKDEPLRVNARSDGSMVAFWGIPWLFLYDVKSQQPCEVDLGSGSQGPNYVAKLVWGGNGERYLTLVLNSNLQGQLLLDNTLMVLDTQAQESYKFDFGNEIIEDMVWMSDNETLLLFISIGNGGEMHAFKLANVLAKTSQTLFSESRFGGGATGGYQFEVSPNTEKIAVKCPVWPDGEPILEDRVCLIEVSSK